jgi:hypothetical protein
MRYHNNIPGGTDEGLGNTRVDPNPVSLVCPGYNRDLRRRDSFREGSGFDLWFRQSKFACFMDNL